MDIKRYAYITIFIIFISRVSRCHGNSNGRILHETTKANDYKSFFSKYLYDTNDPSHQAEHLKEAESILFEEIVQSISARFPTQGHLVEFVNSIAMDKTSGIGLKCSIQIGEMFEGFVNVQKWAIQMLDSWGKPGPGLLRLYPVFNGEYQECIDVRAYRIWAPTLPPLVDNTTQSTQPTMDSANIVQSYNKSKTYGENPMKDENSGVNDDSSFKNGIKGGYSHNSQQVRQYNVDNRAEREKEMSTLDRLWSMVKSKQFADKTDEKPLFKGKYCKVGVSMPHAPIQYTELPILKIYIGVSLGVCLPDSCNARDADIIVNKTLQAATFDSNQTLFAPQKSVCQEEVKADSTVIIIASVLGLALVGVFFATAYDVIYMQRPRWKLQALKEEFVAKRKALLEATETPIPGPLITNGHSYSNSHLDNGHLDNGHVINGEDLAWLLNRDGGPQGVRHAEEGDGDTKRPLEDILFDPPPLTQKEKYISFFSVYTNGTKILNTNLNEGTLTTLHGFRFLSMCWIILGHSMLIGMVNVENVIDFMWEMKKDTLFLIISNGFLCVDAFFVMSGMMVGYFFQGIIDHDCRYKWIVYVIHRFVRLSPALGIFIAIYLGFWPYLGSGPNYPAKAPDEDMCRETWLYTIFYVNNFLPLDKLCLMWTWYLSCDYQFYLICPIFMIPITKGYRKVGIALGVMFIVGTMLASGIISYHYGMAEMLPQLFTPDGLSRPQDYYNMFYQRPYCRMGPYVVGLFLGHALWVTDRKVKMPRWLVVFGWTASTVVALATLFGVHSSFAGYDIMSHAETAVYNALKHTVFGLCVAWVLWACLTGYGGYVQTILSFKAFIPLSRLTYCTYLVHPFVVYLYSYSQNGVFWLNSWNLAFNYLGVLVSSIIMGGTLSVLVESPTIRIEREILIQLDLAPPSANF